MKRDTYTDEHNNKNKEHDDASAPIRPFGQIAVITEKLNVYL